MAAVAFTDIENDGGHATDAWLAAQLFAIDPGLIGGIVVQAAAGPVRDRWQADLRAMLPTDMPWRSAPLHVDDDRLLGGIDLAATLRLGRPVALRGLLAEAHGGVLMLAMAERIAASTVAHVAAALDAGVLFCARHGVESRLPARFGVVAFDEGAADDERPAPALRDRLAFHVDLRELAWRDVVVATSRQATTRADIEAACARLPAVAIGDDIVDALCAAAFALGVDSMRACIHAVQVARLAAAHAGRQAVASDDAALAARLVLAPRATRLPAVEPAAQSPTPDEGSPDEGSPGEAEHDPAQVGSDDARDAPEQASPSSDAAIEDRVLAAAAAAIPAGLLAQLAAGLAGGTRGASGRAGAFQASHRRGRPAGARRVAPRGGGRLDVIATLRAAAPWQRVRGRSPAAGDASPGPIRVRSEDFHVARYRERRRTTAIFAVDASGSAALHRLGEAKGAVELLLADCYVRRDSVAVLAFRGRSAELLLPPTRSLARAKRSLAALPGGGGTPLASAIDAARELASLVRRRGDTPVIVVLSDGRANVSRDGSPGRPGAEADARVAARSLRGDGITTLFIDTSPQPHPLARELAAAMGARYVPLPHAEAAALSKVIGAATRPDLDR